MRKTNIIIILIIFWSFGFIFSQERAKFRFKGEILHLKNQFLDQNNSRLILEENKTLTDISTGLRGFNYSPEITTLPNSYLISFRNNFQGKKYLYLYDSDLKSSYLLFHSPDFKFLSDPKVILNYNKVTGILFLGNKSNNDELFYYSLDSEKLINLTDTNYSEKKFYILSQNPLKIKVVGLWNQTNLVFDTQTLKMIQTITQKRVMEGSIKNMVTIKNAQNDSVWNRTFLTFGDSITAGWMKMDWLSPDIPNYPELAYTYKTQQKLKDDFGEIFGIRMGGGYPAHTSFQLFEYIHSDLSVYSGKYFFCYMGMNDTRQGDFSVDSSIETFEAIVDAALLDNRTVIMTTINPIVARPDQHQDIQLLNIGIKQLAQKKGLTCIDIHQAFVEYNSGNGWRELLEDRGDESIHPSPLGHDLIADLLSQALKDFKPEKPVIESIQSISDFRKKITWFECLDFDYEGSVVEYGYSSSVLSHKIDVTTFEYVFNLLPFKGFLKNIYYRIKNFDSSGNESESTAVDFVSSN